MENQSNTIDLWNLLCCPKCKADVEVHSDHIVCTGCSQRYEIVDGIPVMLIKDDMDSTRDISLSKWGEHYDNFDVTRYMDDYRGLYESYANRLFERPVDGLKCSSNIVLEIGCGPGASRGFWFDKGFGYVGIDFSLSVLRAAKGIKEFPKERSLFVCGDILNPPFKKDVFAVIWGSGVIEHFRDTLGSLKLIRKITTQGGRILATFPYLSLGSITYRQLWGNIPDFPVLREIAEFVHIVLLKKKLMKFGFEYSFPEYKIRKLVKEAGLELNEFDHFDVYTSFDFIKNETVKNILRKMEKLRLFWAMAYLIAEKTK
ncbi:methyltransferase domain-containing protein [Candidatus Auribacterota bacterium]